LDSRQVNFKSDKEREQLPSFVKEKIENLPVDIPFTITETFRTKEEYDNLKKQGYEVSEDYNDHSRAIDVRTDEQGHTFVKWLMNDGKEWSKNNVKEIRRHGKKGTDHYHIVFK